MFLAVENEERPIRYSITIESICTDAFLIEFIVFLLRIPYFYHLYSFWY